MATKKQKEELMQVLKFTPCTYKVELYNYGGECYIGTVDRKIYDFFKEHKIDLDEYVSWSDDEKWDFIPEELRPFPPGSPYECDNLCHASGASMEDGNVIDVQDENGNKVWECALSVNQLEDAGVEVDEWESVDIDSLEEGTVVFFGGQGEKGLLFGGEIELKAPFDPKKLKLNYSNADGWWICNGVTYDGEDIDNDDYSTTGKWGESKWIIVGGEEVYEGVSREDTDDEDEENQEIDLNNGLPSEDEMPQASVPEQTEETTEWFSGDVTPVHKGTYEVTIGATAAWPFPNQAFYTWTGKSWKDVDGKKATIHLWRGLKEQSL